MQHAQRALQKRGFQILHIKQKQAPPLALTQHWQAFQHLSQAARQEYYGFTLDQSMRLA